MKKLFTNYNFDFTKNEKKLLRTFSNQTLKQIQGDSKLFAEERAFTSIIQKLDTGSEQVKLTKDERTRLKHQLEQNVKFIDKEMSKAWFLKKWLYKSMLAQYKNILENHFKG
jgi:hypothetical protein